MELKGMWGKKIDRITFLWCYDKWRKGEMNFVEFGKRCGVSYVTIINKLNYLVDHNWVAPECWFYEAETHNIDED